MTTKIELYNARKAKNMAIQNERKQLTEHLQILPASSAVITVWKASRVPTKDTANYATYGTHQNTTDCLKVSLMAKCISNQTMISPITCSCCWSCWWCAPRTVWRWAWWPIRWKRRRSNWSRIGPTRRCGGQPFDEEEGGQIGHELDQAEDAADSHSMKRKAPKWVTN